MFSLQSLVPYLLPGTEEFRWGLFGSRQVLPGVSVAGNLVLPTGGEGFQPKLADSLQHDEAWLITSSLHVL